MPPNPEMTTKTEASEDESSDTDSEESPTNSFSNGPFLVRTYENQVNSSTDDSGNGSMTLIKPNFQVSEMCIKGALDNKVTFCQVPGRLSLLGTYDNHANSSTDDSGNGSMTLIKPNFQVSEMCIKGA
uniref:Uncharacterized protein n=1 Tax=Panagrolaimus sp. JU765 TaxID=591449 RepID=A0AC34QB70_9BILA